MEFSSLSAVGVWFYSRSTDRYLYLLRNDPKHPGSWGLVGGKVHHNETLLGAIDRECCEEIGQMPTCSHLIPIEKFVSHNGFVFNTFFAAVADEFRPILNHEHIGYAWIESGAWPKPMHPGLWNTVNFEVIQHKLEIIMSTLSTDNQSRPQ